ncbi:hypothetical protein POPTR_012G012000v4 [Populus trichocarpa]|uniref:Uncharacterized protein n=1 Tax=Populus trichocarpa TaxID=3694 RepID=A0A2K1Y745_POPTR|nr:UPF0481 protein At3g47200 [Populus trichocarpa]XP_052301674.1 UPF0481 protein At3g47200 [Populus trichocarpa]XP_052301675.1 UPF0481 protein At3g47200 [Populus trichocarpa]PNT08851.1 hypothetical protein POPTR_012G012000v4 [Populus trichocarpa]|eukprot:XP_024438010.1 UPF0481 protein At3g47200 [Populus trichocarpa]
MAGGSGSASTSIDIEELLKDFPDRMQTTLPEEMCIYHVPVDIRQVNKDAYTPQVICIGPIHQKNENQFMKELKRRYFKQFLDRLPVGKRKPVLEDLVETIKGRVDKIRNCYEDAAYELCKDPKGCEFKIHNCYEDAAFELRKDPKDREVEILDCSEDDSSKRCEDQKVFWKMILWDAVFIFELFLKNREFKEDKKSQGKEDTEKYQEKYQEKYKYDYIIAKPWLRSAVQRDLILLENQLPFFILQVLYGIVSKYNITGYSCPPKTGCSCLPETDKTCCSCLPETDCCCPCIAFRELTCTFFKKYNKNKNKTSPEKPLHFTDLVRSFFLPKDLNTKDPNPKDPSSQTIKKHYRATRLHQAGMKFKPKKPVEYNIKSWTDPEDDSIEKGKLYLPTLEIDDHTECLFRNLMALEQCHYPYEAFICGYVIFLDFLVDTKEDADLLIKSEVIVNMLGESDGVAKLINKLCQGIAEVSSCYNRLAQALDKYYDSRFNKRKAYLRRHYFKNVWIGTGTVVGLIVLFITLGNFVRSFF